MATLALTFSQSTADRFGLDVFDFDKILWNPRVMAPAITGKMPNET